jgi:hypothetical protein
VQSTPAVTVRREPIVLPTYEPLPADKNPMFLEKRVYLSSYQKFTPEIVNVNYVQILQ